MVDDGEPLGQVELERRAAVPGLGVVVVHEQDDLGHVLLGPPYHDDEGLMRPAFRPNELGDPDRAPFRLTCGAVNRLRHRIRVMAEDRQFAWSAAAPAALAAFALSFVGAWTVTRVPGHFVRSLLPFILLAVALYNGLTTGWGQWTPGAAGALLFGGVLSVNVCYVIWYRGVQRLGGARTIVMDMNAARLAFVREKMGVPDTILLAPGGDAAACEELIAITNGQLADVVVDATGSNKSMAGALAYCAYAARLEAGPLWP